MDTNKLKELAERATPGRNFDRLPSAGGGLKYTCTGDDDSLVLRVDHKNGEFGFIGPKGEEDEAFFLACTPQEVLELIAEVERLRGEVETYEDGMRSLASQLGAGGYNAETLTAAQLVDKVKWGVDNFSETQGRLLDEVRAENTALRKDAERYRELRKITPHRFKKLQEAATTDGGDVFYFHSDRFDAALDAALEGGGR